MQAGLLDCCSLCWLLPVCCVNHVCVCVCVCVFGRFGPDFPTVAGVWEGADCCFALLQASGPPRLPEAVPITGIDFGLGSSPVLALQKGP